MEAERLQLDGMPRGFGAGMIWTQLVVEVIMLPVSLGMYFHTFRVIKAGS